MTYPEYVEKYGLTSTSTVIPERISTIGDEYYNSISCHYVSTLKTKEGKVIWKGEYSKGFGIAEAWARGHKSAFSSDTRQLLRKPVRYGRLNPESEYVQEVRRVSARHIKPTSTEILESLALDSLGSGQPFKDWAADYGYSDDSISAHKVWLICNDTRRALALHLDYDLLMECEE